MQKKSPSTWKPVIQIWSFTDQDGQEVTVSLSATPLLSRDGRVISLFGMKLEATLTEGSSSVSCEGFCNLTPPRSCTTQPTISDGCAPADSMFGDESWTPWLQQLSLMRIDSAMPSAPLDSTTSKRPSLNKD